MTFRLLNLTLSFMWDTFKEQAKRPWIGEYLTNSHLHGTHTQAWTTTSDALFDESKEILRNVEEQEPKETGTKDYNRMSSTKKEQPTRHKSSSFSGKRSGVFFRLYSWPDRRMGQSFSSSKISKSPLYTVKNRKNSCLWSDEDSCLDGSCKLFAS